MSKKVMKLPVKRKYPTKVLKFVDMAIPIQPEEVPVVKKIRLWQKPNPVMKNTCVDVDTSSDYAVTSRTCFCIETLNGASWVRERFLGQGGFGIVCLARRRNPCCDLPAKVAVKCTKMCYASTLVHEKNILSSFTTPYVVKCYGDEVTHLCGGEEVYNVIMEFCELSLHDRIEQREGGLFDKEVRVYTKDILLGLKQVHGENIMHCDIKPENILLNWDNWIRKRRYVAKLADFGLAVDKKSEQEPTSRRGTRLYMSPELVTKKLHGFAGDIWAVGCVVLEMMTGNRVWSSKGNVCKHELKRIIAESSPMSEVPADISDDGRDFLQKCFARNPADRWSADQLIQHPFLTVI